MSLMQRVGMILGAKANKALNAAENPGETLDYSYEQQLEQLQNAKRGLVDLAAAKQRLLLQQSQAQNNLVTLETQARQAVAAGRDDLATAALQRKATAQQQLQMLDEQVAGLQTRQDNMTATISALEQRIERFRTEKEVMKGTYAAAQAQVKIGEAATGIGQGLQNTGLAIQRARDKTEAMESRAAALTELTSSGALDDFTGSGDHIGDELAKLSSSTQVDDELSRLKAELGPVTATPAIGGAKP